MSQIDLQLNLRRAALAPCFASVAVRGAGGGSDDFHIVRQARCVTSGEVDQALIDHPAAPQGKGLPGEPKVGLATGNEPAVDAPQQLKVVERQFQPGLRGFTQARFALQPERSFPASRR